MAESDLNASRLRELLNYDRDTGAFTWRTRVSQRVRAGSLAGGPSKDDGRWRITVDGVKYLGHRLAWLYVHGEWPPGELDHTNGDGHMGNNRISDLRPVTSRVNTQNQRRARSDNKSSGLLGVHWDKRYGGHWVSHIGVNGKQKYLGQFDTPQAAHAAYLEAKRRLHPGCTI